MYDESEQLLEKLMMNFSASIKCYASWMGSCAHLQAMLIDTMHKIHENTAAPDKDFGSENYNAYNLWKKLYGETLKQFLCSEHFSNSMNAFMSDFIASQELKRNIIEAMYLKPAGLPTKTQIDEINKEIYFLRKKCRELKHELNELKENCDECRR